MRLENGLWIPAFAGMTALALVRHSREGGNPWLSGNRSLALRLTLQREMALTASALSAPGGPPPELLTSPRTEATNT